VTTLILNCKVSRLARLTGHMTLSDTTTTSTLTVSRENIKVRKLLKIPRMLSSERKLKISVQKFHVFVNILFVTVVECVSEWHYLMILKYLVPALH